MGFRVKVSGHLSDIDGRVEGVANVVEDVCTKGRVVASEHVDLHLRRRNPVSMVVERPPGLRLGFRV